MKFSCTQENLALGLNIVSHIASRSTNLPIIQNILIQVENKQVELVATNLELGVRYSLRAKVDNDGTYTVDSKIFTDYVGLLNPGRVDVGLDGGELDVSTDKQHSKLHGQPATDFPVLPEVDLTMSVVVNPVEWRQAVSEVVFAASHSETRPEISGVYCEVDAVNKKITLAATDSYRLAERRLVPKGISGITENISCIIPVRAVQEMSRIIGLLANDDVGGEVDEVVLYITNNQLLCKYRGADIVTRLIEGRYPSYQAIIPQQFTTTTTIDRADFVKGIKTASLFSKSGIFDLRLHLMAAQNEVVISASNSQTGESRSQLAAAITGEEGNIVLNHRYLLDGLQVIKSDEVVISTNDGNSPCALRNKDSQDYLYIVMPIRQ